MQTVKILIVEDELLIAEFLKGMLEKMGYQVPAIFASGAEALEWIRPGAVDIVIMDIHLKGEMNGIETAVGIRDISTAPIIYVTDNMDEVLRRKAIYEPNTVQYVTKPFNQVDIAIAIELALKAIRVHELQLQHAGSYSYLVNDCIFVKEGQVFRKLPVADIMLLKAEGSYCKLIYKNEKRMLKEILFSENLSFVEEKLKFARNFYRVHRSYVINVDFLKRLQDNRLWIEEEEVPVGKTYRAELKSRLRFI